jgi:hypothetical protein
MRPKTTVRPPIIAGAQRRHLSELLRKWRRQPRRRSRLLFGILLVLALMSDAAVLLLGLHLLGSHQPHTPPPADRRIHVPYADDAKLWQPLRRWAVRAQGKTCLFESYCRDAVLAVTGEESFEQRDPLAVVVSWMLDADADSLEWETYPFIRCEAPELRAVFYGDESNPSRMARDEQFYGRFIEPATARSCRAFQDLLRDIDAQAGPLSNLQRQAVAVQKRLARWQRIRAGEVEGINGVEMRTVSAEMCQAYQSGDKELFAAALNDFLDSSRRTLGLENDAGARRRLDAEAWLNKRAPERKAMVLSFLAAICLAIAALVKMRRPVWHRVLFRAGLMAALGCVAWSAAALVKGTIRDDSLIGDGQRGMFFLAAAIMTLGLLLAWLHGEDLLARCAAAVSSVGFLLAAGESPWPTDFDHGVWPGVQGLLLLSAFAGLIVAWSIAVVAFCGVLCATPNGEWLRRLGTYCMSAVRMSVVLLTGSAFVDAVRALLLHETHRVWNPQALGTLILLPAGFLLLHARRRDWMQPFAAMMGVGIAVPMVALVGYFVHRAEMWNQLSLLDATLYAAGLINGCLLFHAALRYYYGRQRVFDA